MLLWLHLCHRHRNRGEGAIAPQYLTSQPQLLVIINFEPDYMARYSFTCQVNSSGILCSGDENKQSKTNSILSLGIKRRQLARNEATALVTD